LGSCRWGDAGHQLRQHLALRDGSPVEVRKISMAQKPEMLLWLQEVHTTGMAESFDIG